MIELDPQEVAEKIQMPFENWARRCHEISLAIVKSGIMPGKARVARGFCKGVVSQHSWVVAGWDCYNDKAQIIDPTLWSYDPTVEGIYTARLGKSRHTPHGGAGTIWTAGKPPTAIEEPIELAVPLSDRAREFLEMCGPMDRAGWSFLSDAPVRGWPAGEIYAAMDQTPDLAVLLPIDRLGMLTDLNPSGLYF